MEADRTVDILSPAFKADPYPFYARLRAESPVHRVALPRAQSAWLVTRYDDVVAVLKDDRFVKDKKNALTPDQSARQPWMPGIVAPLTRNMLDLDAPDHTRLRALVHKAFTPRLVEQMRTRVETLTEELLDGVAERDEMDLIGDYALLVPTTIIAEMLGVPVADRLTFHRWSTAILTGNLSKWHMLRAVPAVISFLRYARRLTRARRAEPQDDLVTALVQAEEAGDQMDEDELVAMIFLLLTAGYETTVNLIGNGTLALLENPEQMEMLRRDPSLIKSGVEELARFYSPVETATERYASTDVTVAGVTIPRGSLVLAVLASANRDAGHFTAPDTLDITRDPNRHLAFGQGIHYCLGAPLARLEAQIAINTLLRRCPNLCLAGRPAALRWRPGLALRGMVAMPVVLGARGQAAGRGQPLRERVA